MPVVEMRYASARPPSRQLWRGTLGAAPPATCSAAGLSAGRLPVPAAGPSAAGEGTLSASRLSAACSPPGLLLLQLPPQTSPAKAAPPTLSHLCSAVPLPPYRRVSPVVDPCGSSG
eukprot:357218-Chlamydomonas_euryale.AAC.4